MTTSDFKDPFNDVIGLDAYKRILAQRNVSELRTGHQIRGAAPLCVRR